MKSAVEFSKENLKEFLGQWISGRELDKLPDTIIIPFDEKYLTNWESTKHINSST